MLSTRRLKHYLTFFAANNTEKMNNAQLEEIVVSLHKLLMAQQGTIAAQRVMIDSVVSALSGLPTFTEVVNETLTALEPHARDELEVDSVESFDSTISHFNHCLDVSWQR
jgi:hypothetical protein